MGALNLRRGRSAGRECLSKPDRRTNLHSRRGIERISTINANGDFGQPDEQQPSSPGPHFIVAGTRITYPLPTSIADSTGYTAAIGSGHFFEIRVAGLILFTAN